MRTNAFARVAAILAFSSIAFHSAVTHGASTDISNSPVVASDTNATPVPPNIMFIVDDSGSMDWDFLPDWANDYYCKRANGSVEVAGNSDSYSTNALCCRNRSGGSSSCTSGTGYSNTGTSVARMDVPMSAADFNNVYYNPAIVYTPPRNADGTSKTSQTCANTGGTVSGTSCTGGWASVKLDAYGIQEASSTTFDLTTQYPDIQWCDASGNCRANTNYFYPNQIYKTFKGVRGKPYYYVIQAGEYCDSNKLTNCTVASAPSTSYPWPAKIRWCSDTALTTCQAIKNATYKYPRYPTLMPSSGNSGSVTAVFTLSGSTTDSSNQSLSITSLAPATTGPNLMSASSVTSNNVDTVANNMVAKIGNGYVASSPTCTTSGSTRTCTVTVLAPASGTCPSGNINVGRSDTSSGTAMTFTVNLSFTSCRTPGNFIRVDIDPTVNSYPYPGSASKATTRTDCAGTTCTYLEEMTNFANWFTYYRTRMQMMKSASSLAFSGLGDSYRVGYMTINNNNSGTSVAGSSGDYLNIDTFGTTQKTNWYSKLFSAKPSNGTPLRSALSTAGLIYGGVLNGTTFNGSTVKDPMLYSCQKSFTILSTDGYWNTGNDSGCSGRSGQGCKLNQSSAVGNADGIDKRPYSDGTVVTVTTTTPTTTTTTVTTPRTVVRTDQRTDRTSNYTIVTTPLTYLKQTVGASQGNCAGGRWRYIYNSNGTATRTVTTNNYSDQTYTRTVTTDYSDVTTSSSTSTQKVVTTNGVVTSDTTTTTTSGPTTVSTTTAGPTTSAWAASGAPVTGVSGPTSVDSSITWGTATNTGTLICTSLSNGAQYSYSGPTLGGSSTTNPSSTATGTVTSSTATTNGASTTVVNGPNVGTASSTTTTAGGVSDTLADVAYYYYNTDLRAAGSTNPDTHVDVGTGDYDSTSGTYANSVQRMSTYTLGLGIDGYMKFSSDYLSASSGDYYDVINGATSTASRCTWLSSGSTCNWPTPSSDSQANIDDLWHAAVNGHGTYFSARDPAELSAGLSSALSSIAAKDAAAAAATTSNPNITSGDNFLFSSDFRTKEWTSHLMRLRIDPASGVIITTTDANGKVVPVVDWEAQSLLDARVSASSDTRTIYTFSSDVGQTSFCGTAYNSATKLKPFCWTGASTSYPGDTSLTAAEQNNFQGATIASLPQFCTTGTYTLSGETVARTCLTSAQQTSASGKNLVNFLRGQNGHEDQSGVDAAERFYRDRVHVLGDIVSSEAVYVKTPLANYADTGFSDFKTTQSSNVGMVYVAANDGMLHAFNAETGAEVWAYIPTMAMSKLYNLASMNYGNTHRFLVDGTPVVDYAYIGGSWKTVLVGGLAAGGAGYYALDITDPANPKGLWEFKQRTTSCAATTALAVGDSDDCDLGYSFGNPVITKLEDGTWVVLVTSGYNNTTPGDGQGYLYVLSAADGTIIRKIGTGVGSNAAITGVCDTAPCPSGLSKIAAWVDNPDTNNTTKRVYGGDLFGNLWRFDVNNTIGASGYDATQLALLKGPNAALQPITERPELGDVNGTPIVLVGTGRLLGDSDKSDPNQTGSNRQSFYGIKDPLSSTGWGDVRVSATGFVQQTLTINAADQSRTGTKRSVNLATAPGWYVDFPDSGERSYTDPSLALGTITFTTNLPQGTACSSSGQSFIYFLDYRSGAPVISIAGAKLGNALATRPVVVQLEGGAIRSIVRLSDTTTWVGDVPVGSGSTTPRRVSWRQLFAD